VKVGDWGSVVSAFVAVAGALGALVGFSKSRGAGAEAERQAMRAVAAAERGAAAEQRMADATEHSASNPQAQALLASEQADAEEHSAWQIIPIPGRSNCRLHNGTARSKYNVRVTGLAVHPQEIAYPLIPGHGWVEIDLRAGWGSNREVEVSWNCRPGETNEPLTWRGQLSQLRR
jgi:hypothetical protein